MITAGINIHDIKIQSPLGETQPGDLTTKKTPDGYTEIIVGEGTDTRVRRISIDDPEAMEEHAKRHLKIAANFMAAAKVLRNQQNNDKLDKARKAILKEFGFGYSDRFEDYTQPVQSLIDTLIKARGGAAEVVKKMEEPARVKFFSYPFNGVANGRYMAYNRQEFGDNAPGCFHKSVEVRSGRVYTPVSFYDITSNFKPGADWVLVKP